MFSDKLAASKDSEKEMIEIHDEVSAWINDFYAKYRKFEIKEDSWLIPKIRDMHKKGMIDPFG